MEDWRWAFVQRTNFRKAYGISGPKLAQLPEFIVNNHERTHESAKARPIRTKHDGHVAREIHSANGIRIVVQVRWMQARLAAILACPLRTRPDQPHARAVGVVGD